MEDEGFCKCNVLLLLLGLSIDVETTMMLMRSSGSLPKVMGETEAGLE